MIDQAQALANAIKAKLEEHSALSSVKIVAGQPGDVLPGENTDLNDHDGEEMPCIAISIGNADERRAAQYEYRQEDTPGGFAQYFAVADVGYTPELVIQATTKTSRGEIAMAVYDMFSGGEIADFGNVEPSHSGMPLVLDDHYSASARLRITNTIERDIGTQQLGYYERRLQCACVVPRLRRIEYKKQTINNTVVVDTELE